MRGSWPSARRCPVNRALIARHVYSVCPGEAGWDGQLDGLVLCLDGDRPPERSSAPMLSLLAATTAISTGYGLSPGSCVLPHVGGGPEIVENDLLAGSACHPSGANAEGIRAVQCLIAAAAASAASVCSVPAANAASGQHAVDLVVKIGELSAQAKQRSPKSSYGEGTLKPRQLRVAAQARDARDSTAAAAPQCHVYSSSRPANLRARARRLRLRSRPEANGSSGATGRCGADAAGRP